MYIGRPSHARLEHLYVYISLRSGRAAWSASPIYIYIYIFH